MDDGTARGIYRRLWRRFRHTWDDEERHDALAKMSRLQELIAPPGSDEWREFISTLDGYIEFLSAFDDILAANKRENAYKGE